MTGYHAMTSLRPGWCVRRSGSKKAVRVGLTKEAAWALAKTLADRAGVTAYQHRTDGTIARRADGAWGSETDPNRWDMGRLR